MTMPAVAVVTYVWAYHLPTWLVLTLMAVGVVVTVAVTLIIVYTLTRKVPPRRST